MTATCYLMLPYYYDDILRCRVETPISALGYSSICFISHAIYRRHFDIIDISLLSAMAFKSFSNGDCFTTFNGMRGQAHDDGQPQVVA